MGRCIRQLYNSCKKCGRAGVNINGTPLCKTCHRLQKLRSVELLSRLTLVVGLLPQSYFDVIEQLKREYRCMGCRSVNFGEIVTCETCMKHVYCSFQCLQADKVKHTPVCLYILIAKGTSDLCQRAPHESLLRILLQAKTLNDTEYADFKELHCIDRLHISASSQDVLKQACIGTFTKNSVTLARTFPSLSNKDRCRQKSPAANKLMTRVEKTKSLETKKQNKIVVDFVIACDLVKQAKYSSDTFQDVKRVLSNGMFARFLCDDGMKFGKGWWKCFSNIKLRKQTLKIEFKPFATAPRGVPEPEFGLTFYDFYDDSDSEEVQQEAHDVRGLLDSSGNSIEPSSTTSNISPNLPTGAPVNNKQQTQDTTSTLSSVSESSRQTQVLTGNKPSTDKQNGNKNSQKKKRVSYNWCMFCHRLSSNLKTCARCGYGKYCSKSCQVNGFSDHKLICKHMREMNHALSMIPSVVTDMLERKYGTAEISFSCESVPMFPFPMFPWDEYHLHVLVKIIHVVPKPGVFMITVEDNSRTQEKLLLQHTLPYSMFHAPDFGIPIPLTSYLQPGNYILLIDAHRVPPFCGDCLVCSDENCFFILRK